MCIRDRPKTTWSKDYLQELWDEETKYLKSIRESKNGYGFDDIGMGAAYAYSTMYQKIVEGYRNGTRAVSYTHLDVYKRQGSIGYQEQFL